QAMQDLLNAMPLIRDPGLRASLYPKAEPLLHALPKSLAQSAREDDTTNGSGPEDAIRHAAMNALTSVRGEESRTFKALAPFIRSDKDRHAAIRAIRRIPATSWPPEEARPMLDGIMAFARKLPIPERTSPEALDALQLGDALAALLPRDQARAIREELGELGVRVVRIGTVTDQMRFDTDRIVVQAGKPVAILFENTDLMPHNFVVTRPGALEEVGLLAESTATQPGALERDYIPPTSKILLHSRLLPPREAQKLSFTAPKQPAVYAYVCTYPGHWRRMFGAMYVVEDLNDYLADPEGYLARSPLPVADELLKSHRPRKEWKYEDLAAAAEALDGGRSFSNGKQMFQVASCASCHRMNGVGNEIGPDLAKLDPRMRKPAEVLRHILDPSLKVDDKYATNVFETESGKVISGLVVEETRDAFKLIENPLAKADPVVLKRAEIADRAKSKTSIMPRGLLDPLTREEVLDLLAYVVSRGDERDPCFQGAGHAHAHGPGH
ncbi:MAG: c-type cytochrome, partial [Planctomycetaceae bacterium]|nr:c-type cytochrome [Planctomycetaceae bacterium]